MAMNHVTIHKNLLPAVVFAARKGYKAAGLINDMIRMNAEHLTDRQVVQNEKAHGVPRDGYNLLDMYNNLKAAEDEGLKSTAQFHNHELRKYYIQMMNDIKEELGIKGGGRINKSKRINRRNKRRSYRY